MQKFILLLTIGLTFMVVQSDAQFDSLKKKIEGKPTGQQPTVNADNKRSGDTSSGASRNRSHGDDDFLLMGKNGMEGTSIVSLTACAPQITTSLSPPMSKAFKVWITDISDVAALRTFNSERCEVIAFLIQDKAQYKYRNVDSLAETAQGHSVYRVESSNDLALVKKFDAAQFYVVVVPQAATAGLKLADLYLCGSPDTIKQFRRKTASVSNCHNLDQSLYVFEKYKRYPSPTATNSAIFDSDSFNSLNKQGKFKGLVTYKLVGEELVRIK